MAGLLAIYVRISRDEGEQSSTARQERLCRRWAKDHGWSVTEVFEDIDRSAFSPSVVREAYERLVTEVAAGRLHGVLVWRLDRLVRSPAEFERFWSVCQRWGVAVISATEPVDSSDPVGVAIVRLLVTFAGLESDVKSIRLAAKNRELAEAGLPPAGPRRYGYTPGHTEIVESEAALIREAAERVLNGESVYVIARDWRDRGVLGIRDRPWTVTGVRSLLRSRRLVGERTYRGEVVATNCWPAILDPLTAAEVRNHLAGRPGGAQRRPTMSLLQGRIRCGLCGTPMVAAGRRDEKKYVCRAPRGCGHVCIDRPTLEAWMVERVLARIEARHPKNHRQPWRRQDTNAAVRALDAQSDRLVELNRRYYVTGDLSYPEWVKTRDALLVVTEQQLARTARVRLPRGYPPSRRLGEARQLWDQLSVQTRQGVIATELIWITIDPAPCRNGIWYPTRIRPNWTLPDPPGAQLPPGRARRLRVDWDYEPGRPPRPHPAHPTREELLHVDRSLSQAEACIITGLSHSGLWHRLRDRRIPYQVIDGKRRFHIEDLAK